MSLFTLGHSTLNPDEFADAARGMDIIVDVRSHPSSNHVPHFSMEWMTQWLPDMGFKYEWRPELGGWDKRHKPLAKEFEVVGVDVDAYAQGYFPRQTIGADRPSINQPSWTNRGLYDYAWFTSLPEFIDGAHSLTEDFGSKEGPNAAIICSEALWWKCHRSMIADHLTWMGVWIAHLPIKPPKRQTTPRWKPHIDALGNRFSRYPPAVIDEWRKYREAHNG